MRPIHRWLCSLSLLAATEAHAAPRDFLVSPGAPNEVVFESSAPMETFHGRSRALRGVIHADPEALGDSVTVHFEVDLATLTTGLPKRDRHMRENHLEVAKYPRATFDGVAVLGAAKALAASQTANLDVAGTFTIHGSSRRLHLSVETTLVRDATGESLRFRTGFPVSLAEYGIPRPEFLILKLADVQKVTVQGVATSSSHAPAGVAGASAGMGAR